MVGVLVGLTVVGLLVVGKLVVGWLVVGLTLGLNVGFNVGFNVGVNVGLNVGRKVGLNVGKSKNSMGGVGGDIMIDLEALDLEVFDLPVLDLDVFDLPVLDLDDFVLPDLLVLVLLLLVWSSLFRSMTRSPSFARSLSSLSSTAGPLDVPRIERRSFQTSTRGAACSARTELGCIAATRMTATVAAATAAEEERR